MSRVYFIEYKFVILSKNAFLFQNCYLTFMCGLTYLRRILYDPLNYENGLIFIPLSIQQHAGSMILTVLFYLISKILSIFYTQDR